MRAKQAIGIATLVASACLSPSAWSDQWVNALTPTAAQAQNYGGALLVYITVTQTIVNPAGCPAPDGYVIVDPIIARESLAITLTAITAGHPIQVFVSSTQCNNGRPTASIFQMN
jgi:hypothetical protein